MKYGIKLTWNRIKMNNAANFVIDLILVNDFGFFLKTSLFVGEFYGDNATIQQNRNFIIKTTILVN